MNINQTRATQVVLVSSGQIPLGKLIPRQQLEQLGHPFGFRNAEISKTSADEVVVTFKHGIFDTGTDSHAVDRLVISERKIVFTLEGTSEDAAAFFGELRDFLADLSDRGDDGYLTPIVESQESEIVAKLDFSVEDLFSSAYLDFVRTAVEGQASSDVAKAAVRPVALRFRVDYLLQDESIQEQGISLASKEFTVGPRKGSRLADQVFYSKAPFDTDTHMRLLEELEATLSQSGC